MNDLDELELEEKERQAKKRLSQKFFSFAKLIQGQSEKGNHSIEFDIPIEDFVFEGVPAKSVVKVRPTNKCLISISEYPPFCVELANIEHIHFERVQFGIKNFDMCIVMKDFQTFKHINSIRREELDYIKSYLNEIDIIYSEGVQALSWGLVLKQIREGFEDFMEGGGWKFLVGDDDEDEEGDEEGEQEEEDPEFGE